MTDSAPAAAPASAPSNGAAPAAPPSAPAVPTTVHAGDNFEEFKAQVQARADAFARKQPQQAKSAVPQPTAPPTPPVTQPPPTELVPPPDPNADPNAPAPADPNAPPPDPNAPPQITPEDLELLAKAKAWLASDEIPEEFAQRLVALKNGDAIEYEPFEEVRAGRMRQRDYTRAMQQHTREKEAWQAAEQFYKGHFQAIFNDENEGAAGGDAMYEIYTRAGKRRQLLALGTRLAREEQQIIDGANGVGYAIMHRMGITDPNDYRVQSAVKREYERRHAELDREARQRAMAFENQQLKRTFTERQQDSKNEEFFASQRKSLEQLRPRAFAALGLNHEDPHHRQQFNIYLGAILRQEKADKVTPEVVMKAARAAREEIEDTRRRLANGGGNGAKPGQRGFQPQMSVSGGAPAASKPTQWHSESFAEVHKLPRW
jgi:hypothetical protein